MAVRLENLLPVVALPHADPGNDARLQTLVQQVGSSPTHLQRVFSRVIGESPKRMALRIVLDRIAAALITTGDSILDIVLASGFDSHDGFTRAFRRHFGESPSRLLPL